MNEEHNKTRLGNGPHNLTALRHMGLNAMLKDGITPTSQAFWRCFEMHLPSEAQGFRW
jgi:hypothetical protein